VVDIAGVAKPYLVCGGFPAGNSWIFLGPRGKVEIQGANAALSALLPLFDGTNELTAILGSVGERKDVLALIEMLIDHRIVVDANHLYRHFQAYARYPSLFSMGTSHEENVANYYDAGRKHRPLAGCCEAEPRAEAFPQQALTTPTILMARKRRALRQGRASHVPITREVIFAMARTLIWKSR
jgi:hypothetical protein